MTQSQKQPTEETGWRPWPSEALGPAIVFAVLLVVYLLTMPLIIQARGPLVYAFATALNRRVLRSSDPVERERLQAYIELADTQFYGKLAKATAGFGIVPPERLIELFDEQELLGDRTLDNWTRARFFYLRGHLNIGMGNDEKAVADWWRSVYFNPNPETNKAMENILQHYKFKQNSTEYDRARMTFFPVSMPAHLEYTANDWLTKGERTGMNPSRVTD